jgi:hypothetical protein
VPPDPGIPFVGYEGDWGEAKLADLLNPAFHAASLADWGVNAQERYAEECTMKRTILFALLTLAAPLWAQTLNPTVRVGATLYNCAMIPSGDRAQALAWLFSIVDYMAECPGVGATLERV